MHLLKGISLNIKTCFVAVAASAALLLSGQTLGETVTSGGASITFDPMTSALTSFQLDGVEQLFADALYYRIGDSPEASLSAIGTPVVISESDAITDTAFIAARYRDNTVTVDVRYDLASANSGEAALQTSINVDSEEPLEFTIFEVSDWNLAGTDGDDSLTITGDNLVNQRDGNLGLDHNSLADNLNFFGGNPSAWQASGLPDDIWDLVNNASADDLNNTNTFGDNGNTNGIFANQWDGVLNPNNELAADDVMVISKQQTLGPRGAVEVIPEPVTSLLSLIGVAAAGLTASQRRRG